MKSKENDTESNNIMRLDLSIQTKNLETKD